MSFDTWCEKQFLTKEAKEAFYNWLVEKGFNLKAYRSEAQWWIIWEDYLKEKK